MDVLLLGMVFGGLVMLLGAVFQSDLNFMLGFLLVVLYARSILKRDISAEILEDK